MKQVVYDVEVFPNFFCVCFEDVWSNEKKYFEISPWKDDRDSLKSFIKGKWLLGYNNALYDDIIINAICKSGLDNSKIYELSCMLVNESDSLGIYQKIKRWKYNNAYLSIDISKMLFSKGQRVSLKQLQVTINWPNVLEYDKSFDSFVKPQEIPEIKKYCENDVSSTKAVAILRREDINLRIKILREYNLNCLSKDNVNLGVSLFAKFYEDAVGDRSFYEGRTPRPIIFLKDCISDRIKFKSKEFNNLLTMFKGKMITNTKGAFKEKVLYKETLHVYGTGGIHSKDKPGVIVPKDDEVLIDADVSSYYPSALVLLKACPEHLDEDIFIPIYDNIVEKRIKAKKEGNDFIKDSFKLVLNGTYGNLISEFSWLYDPQQAMKITVNNQLFLTMLSEKLSDNGFKIESINTDGITVRIKKTNLDKFYKICNNWEQYTGFELEYAEYLKVIRRDVNTYFAEYKNGKFKEKGDFLTTPQMGKGYDKPIIQKALKAYFFENIPIEKFIKNHDNIYDFCMMRKMNKKFKAKYNGEFLQKTNRYYASNDPKAGFLFTSQIVDGTEKLGHVLKDSGVCIFNKYEEKDMQDYKINYAYYIRETNKIKELIEPKQLSLF